MRFARAAIVLLTLAPLAVACGSDDDATGTGTGTDAAPRVVEMTMTDNKFEPTEITVTKGETITFEFDNEGTVIHEALIGDDATQAEHADEMTSATSDGMHSGSMSGEDDGTGSEPMAGMGDTTMSTEHQADDEDSNLVVVEPRSSGQLTHTFDEVGELVIGCHETGHWEAGMKATVTIT